MSYEAEVVSYQHASFEFNCRLIFLLIFNSDLNFSFAIL